MPADSAAGSVEEAVSRFGAAATAKLASPTVSGEPEDQLRNPLEVLVGDLAVLNGIQRSRVVLVGESSLADLKTRPDFAVSVDQLVGFIEVKAPGKGADPRRYTSHDKEQWAKLAALPNLLYTDGNSFSLWRSGELVGKVHHLEGDVRDAGAALAPRAGLVGLIGDFLSWKPSAPKNPRQLAEVAARLCRLLRDEVSEQLEAQDQTLAALAGEWRDLLFPEATDDEFADGYAQAVTFGLLMARARGVALDKGIDNAAKELGQKHSLIGAALRVLTDQFVRDSVLATSVATLTRVFAVVDWPTVVGSASGDSRVWLYFYERFLAVYDPALRRRTGSYYTPPEVVDAMTALSGQAVRQHLGRPAGLADPAVTLIDPAMGTGTFLLSVLETIADHVSDDLGEGAVPAALTTALSRLIGFELQLGPYAVAQLRLLAELSERGAELPNPDTLLTFVTDTLDDPYADTAHLGSWYDPIARSRREANEIKKNRRITVVLGNPPYKVASHGAGGWIEAGDQGKKTSAKLQDFMPPADWGVGAHVKHLYNPYVYFWRWALWEAFDLHPDDDHGVICLITVAGFLDGPGFEGMRAYMRRRSDAIWVIDCTPEGHQPPVSSRIFQAVQQPVCIVLAVRDGTTSADQPARTRFRSVPRGPRAAKFVDLAAVSLTDDGWSTCPSGWRAPFQPESAERWADFPGLDDLLRYSGSGIMPGRTWVVAPDVETLQRRWHTLINAAQDRKPELLSEHSRDRRVDTVLSDNLPGFPPTATPIGSETGPCPAPVEIGYRSFDRQWLIPDKRLINRPNPTLWRVRSDHQVFLTALHTAKVTGGPATTYSALVPDLDHYRGSFGGRAFPLWLDAEATVSNVVPGLLDHLEHVYGRPVAPPELFAYIAAVTAHPGYSNTFADDLLQPGVRVPLTAEEALFTRAVELGSRVLWLHARGQRFVDAAAGRPPGAPRISKDRRPRVLAGSPIPSTTTEMPDALSHDPDEQVLRVGDGRIGNVTEAMWTYEVSGVNVLGKWFSYRRRDRERPTMGRRTSPLLDLQLDAWPSTYTTDLIDLLNVLGLLIDQQPAQQQLLDEVLAGEFVGRGDLHDAKVLPVAASVRKPASAEAPTQLTL